jgi:hypothetical protein
MPEIVADSILPSCYYLFLGDRIMEYQLVGPDLSSRAHARATPRDAFPRRTGDRKDKAAEGWTPALVRGKVYQGDGSSPVWRQGNNGPAAPYRCG